MIFPRGKLLIIGGAEDIGDDKNYLRKKTEECNRYEILRELLPRSKSRRIEIITTGSNIQEKVKKIYEDAFHRIGYLDPGFIPIKDKMDARSRDYLDRAENAAAIFFTGGDQFRLSTILGGTKITDIIKRRYNQDPDFLVAGTSAGAMAMSTVMIMEGGLEEALFDRDLKTSSGLGLIHDCIIDTHFIKRGRFGRLAHAVIINPDHLGVGLGEDTALIIKNGTDAECRGSGMVVIIDGRNIGQTNISSAKRGEPVFVENLKVHLLVKGCHFSIHTRKLENPAIRDPDTLDDWTDNYEK